MTGIITLTGRNNVGKSRVMREIYEFRKMLLGESTIQFTNQLKSSIMANIVDGEKTIEIIIDRVKETVNISYSKGNYVRTQVNLTGGGYTRLDKDGKVIVQGSAYNINTAALSSEGFSLIDNNIRRIVYIPPYRTISDKANTLLQKVVEPSGSNLGQILFYHKNKETNEFHEIERVMSDMFPEIQNILTVPSGNNMVTITIKDGFSGKEIPISEAGTGVAQALFLVTMILCSERGRIFLVDEPHVYLHPSAEKALAKFIREHGEHYYIIATHSPLLISKLNPDSSYLITRDKEGTKMAALFNTTRDREEVFRELGIESSDVVLFESLIFVEGDSDKSIYKILLDKLRLSGLSKNAEVIDISGAGTSEPIEKILDRLDSILNIPHVVVLDGDQKGKKKGPHIKFLPYRDTEHVLLLDPKAIYESISEIVQENSKDLSVSPELHIILQEAKKLVENSISQNSSGDKILEMLFQEAYPGLHYNKRRYGPKIAEKMDPRSLENLRNFFENLFC